ncbi:MAG: adenylate/guanylate cyclase domain-containing protein [Chloroflexota bacterium]|nr:adenylate/guanylate cyclase domain-containing protein [Chloroflexota bacterium]
MKITRAAIQRILIGLGLVVLINLGVLGLLIKDSSSDRPSIAGLLQTTFSDWLMTTFANRAIFGSINIAAIDDKSLAAYGRLDSWDRSHYADLINRLKAADVADVVFDVPLTNPGPGDPQMAQAIQNSMHPRDKSSPVWVVLGVPPSGQGKAVAGKGLEYDAFQNLPPVLAATDAIKASIGVDQSGAVVRRMPFVYEAKGQRLYALPLEAFNSGEQNPPLSQSVKMGDGLVQYGIYTIPTDRYYRMPIYYFASPDKFLSYSFVDLAQGRFDPRRLKGTVVLVGPHGATGLADDYPVPTSTTGKMDSVEIWANALQDLLLGKFITPEPAGRTFGFALGISLLASIVFFRFGVFGWLAAVLLGGGYTAVRFILTVGDFIRPPTPGHEQLITVPNLAYADMAILLSSAVLFVYLYLQEQRSRGQIYEMFGRYVTPAVAKQLSTMESSGQLNLGGTRREATIMFAELRGVTSVGQGAKPEEVLSTLNSYFDQAVKLIIEQGGTINKFIGEDVMVMFNVPLDLPNHAVAACRAAYAAQEFVKDYRTSRGETAAFGIGINSGMLVAGNMGSQDRMEFTVIGDTVNVASRLNGVAKLDEIIISQATIDRIQGCGAKVVDRGEILVKGRQEPVHCYKLVGFGEPGPVEIVGREETVATPAATH